MSALTKSHTWSFRNIDICVIPNALVLLNFVRALRFLLFNALVLVGHGIPLVLSGVMACLWVHVILVLYTYTNIFLIEGDYKAHHLNERPLLSDLRVFSTLPPVACHHWPKNKMQAAAKCSFLASSRSVLAGHPCSFLTQWHQRKRQRMAGKAGHADALGWDHCLGFWSSLLWRGMPFVQCQVSVRCAFLWISKHWWE